MPRLSRGVAPCRLLPTGVWQSLRGQQEVGGGVEMGKQHLRYFSGCGIFCRWEQPIIAVGIVEVRELNQSSS